MEIKYIQGRCQNCGGNQFHFDEKEQTFVCEFCNTEVYQEIRKESDNDVNITVNGDDNKVSVNNYVENKVETYTETAIENSDDTNYHYSGYSSLGYGDSSMIPAVVLMITGMIFILISMFLRSEKFATMLAEQAANQTTLYLTETSIQMMTTVMPMITMTLGTVMIICAITKVAKNLLYPYR